MEGRRHGQAAEGHARTRKHLFRPFDFCRTARQDHLFRAVVVGEDEVEPEEHEIHVRDADPCLAADHDTLVEQAVEQVDEPALAAAHDLVRADEAHIETVRHHRAPCGR